MTTQCSETELTFPRLDNREIRACFDGGTITSDGGALLLGQVEAKTAILRQFATCFTEHRDPDLIEHPVADRLAQRVYGLALGYEDLNDHDVRRGDPLLATVIGKVDPTGADRHRAADRGKPLAGKNTLNRLELTPAEAAPAGRYKKIVATPGPSTGCLWALPPPAVITAWPAGTPPRRSLSSAGNETPWAGRGAARRSTRSACRPRHGRCPETPAP